MVCWMVLISEGVRGSRGWNELMDWETKRKMKVKKKRELKALALMVLVWFLDLE